MVYWFSSERPSPTSHLLQRSSSSSSRLPGVRGDEPGQPPAVVPPLRGLQLPVHVASLGPASRFPGAGEHDPERVLMPLLRLAQTAAPVGAATGSRRAPARTHKPSVDVGCVVCMLCESVSCHGEIFLCHVHSSVCREVFGSKEFDFCWGKSSRAEPVLRAKKGMKTSLAAALGQLVFISRGLLKEETKRQKKKNNQHFEL